MAGFRPRSRRVPVSGKDNESEGDVVKQTRRYEGVAIEVGHSYTSNMRAAVGAAGVRVTL